MQLAIDSIWINWIEACGHNALTAIHNAKRPFTNDFISSCCVQHWLSSNNIAIVWIYLTFELIAFCRKLFWHSVDSYSLNPLRMFRLLAIPSFFDLTKHDFDWTDYFSRWAIKTGLKVRYSKMSANFSTLARNALSSIQLIINYMLGWRNHKLKCDLYSWDSISDLTKKKDSYDPIRFIHVYY